MFNTPIWLEKLIGPVCDCAAGVWEATGRRPSVAVVNKVDVPSDFSWCRINTPVGSVRLLALRTCPVGQVYCMDKRQALEVLRYERRWTRPPWPLRGKSVR